MGVCSVAASLTDVRVPAEALGELSGVLRRVALILSYVVDRLGSVLVVGGGLAGLRACEVLRQHGFEGPLALIGAEKHPPYDRPPLSKQLLAGSWDTDRCTLRTSEELETLGLELHL